LEWSSTNKISMKKNNENQHSTSHVCHAVAGPVAFSEFGVPVSAVAVTRPSTM
jgi:hypothetical protein